MKSLLNKSLYFISFVLVLSLGVQQSNCFAQNYFKISDEPGGGTTIPQEDTGNDNTFIYVAGGLIIAGILAYALLIKKDKKNETDTVSVSQTTDDVLNTNFPAAEIEELSKAKENLPVDFFFGIRNDEALLRSKTYLIGVKVSL